MEHDFTKHIKFTNPFEGKSFEKLKRSLLAILLRQKDKLFQSSMAPDGSAWAPISQGAKARKVKKNRLSDDEISEKAKTNPLFAGHKILVDTGRLKNSLTNAVAPYSSSGTAGNEVRLGTNVPYAAIQNFGGKWVSARGYQIEIKARPFIGFGERDDAQVSEYINTFIAKASK